jgi:hypothetical protein
MDQMLLSSVFVCLFIALESAALWNADRPEICPA